MFRFKKSNYVSCLVLLSVLGCSLGQDPFRSESENVKKGIPPHSKPDTKPITSESLIFDTPAYMVFMEGRESVYQYDLRVLIPFKSSEITIVSAPEGFEIDPAEKTIKWTPPRGLTEEKLQVVTEIILGAIVETDTMLYIEKPVLVYVERSREQIQITSTQGIPASMVEGARGRFTVVVEEPGSTEKRIPYLLFENNSTGWDCTKYISQTNMNFVNGTWKFEYTISLANANGLPSEITSGATNCSIMATPYSSLNIAGAPRAIGFQVKNLLKDITWTWNEKLEWSCSQPNSYSFLVFDVDYAASLTFALPNLVNLPGSPTLACSRIKIGLSSCLFNWTCPEGTMGQYTIPITVKSNDGYTTKTIELKGKVGIQ